MQSSGTAADLVNADSTQMWNFVISSRMDPRFHVYIDEAGDPGVKEKNSSDPVWHDWFVLSAVVIDASREHETVVWVDEMRQAIGRKSRSPIHYRNLSDESRLRVCEVLGGKEVRLFVVASHKDSMRRHRSAKLGKPGSQDFYNWCLRLLLERVTQWCAGRCKKNGVPTHPAKIVFSERGGHNYYGLRKYLRKLEVQTLIGSLHLDAMELAPGVIIEKHCHIVPAQNMAGLQLADIAASSFFQAANSILPKHDLRPAEQLIGRLARSPGMRKPRYFGMLLLPFREQESIQESDRTIFRKCGYRF